MVYPPRMKKLCLENYHGGNIKKIFKFPEVLLEYVELKSSHTKSIQTYFELLIGLKTRLLSIDVSDTKTLTQYPFEEISPHLTKLLPHISNFHFSNIVIKDDTNLEKITLDLA